jgi:hypothetical protein
LRGVGGAVFPKLVEPGELEAEMVLADVNFCGIG